VAGEKPLGEQMKKQAKDPTSLQRLLHDVINPVSPEVKTGSQSAKRRGLIHDAAIKMAKGKEQYECEYRRRFRRMGHRHAVSLKPGALSDAGRLVAIGGARYLLRVATALPRKWQNG
jgi:hypothetical protein